MKLTQGLEKFLQGCKEHFSEYSPDQLLLYIYVLFVCFLLLFSHHVTHKKKGFIVDLKHLGLKFYCSCTYKRGQKEVTLS